MAACEQEERVNSDGDRSVKAKPVERKCWKSVKKCSGFSKIVHDFTKMRVMAYLSDAAKCVTDVSLASKGLEGRLSPSLGNLTDLLRVNLSHNSLSGGLPLELVSSDSIVVLDVSFNRLRGDMQELPSSTARPLQVLNISSNLFTGGFPSTWKVMNNLVALNASNNSFTGQIPSYLCSSSSLLAVVDLCYNQFTGSIPPGLGNCSMLRVLKAGHNHLRGALPNELFDASLLEYLSLPNNHLNGKLDGAQIIKLRNLANLNLGGNYFSGKIPDSIGQLKKLEELHLDHNKMSGELPSALSNCTNLITVDLKSNHFNGELTKVNFSSLLSLRNLDLLYNNFTGTIPESIYSCSKLAALRISGNNLHGQLSPRIASLKSLTFLSLGFNNFTNITNTLRILKNCEIPKALMEMPMLKSDRIAPRLDPRAFELPVYGTPSRQYRTHIAFRKVLELGNNNLTGEIPPEIGQLISLHSLNLSSNDLSGKIPISICNLTNLSALDLSNNNLTGAVPSALSSLHFLSRFNISYNDLEGPVPSGGQFDTFEISGFDGNNKLCGAMLIHKCGSAEPPPATIMSIKQTDYKTGFAIAFSVFFGVGVLYDQIVLSKYFGWY
uniref:Tyrosine-sulfated glycopeptide receptor 1 n=1 Tax=Aegilops tauschii TaxID=37682 RepID=R7W154_AEGTA